MSTPDPRELSEGTAAARVRGILAGGCATCRWVRHSQPINCAHPLSTVGTIWADIWPVGCPCWEDRP